MSSAPQAVADLVERFARHADDYRRGAYSETHVRGEYIDPLFEALGWDVHNRAGYAEAYKDVVHEDAIKVGGATKAPDYCFRIGGTRKFFLEAKKPSVQIGGDVGPAYQLRRYGWSAKLPLSILSDFEELAVYDCRIRPKPTDTAATARVKYLQYTDYADRWDEIASVFAKQAVLDGRFDKYLAGKRIRPTAEVDAAFLKEIESWRDAMARNIALRNPELSVRDLNFAVQRTIDRIIFLRICEDRGIETYGVLQELLNGQRVYPRLMEKFLAADDRYNSGLFHFRLERARPQDPDELTPGLTIDDKVLKDIIRSLYHPHSPYEFSVLPADILGSVYEQFLGKVIHLTPAHRARVEEKPEVKKAGGVYYTPKYIVDYIVDHTVGRLLFAAEDAEVTEGGKRAPKQPAGAAEPQPSPPSAPSASSAAATPSAPSAAGFRLTPRQASRLRILDPACGSGSFLIGAYRRLLDYHRDWYLADGPGKHRKELYQGAGGQWYLTTDEKKRILLNNIHGVDIDPQAVEVTKLNLLLCVLENENQATLRQLALIHQRALPDLAANVKCGNSLIGTDFYQGKQLDLFDEDTRYRINAFDWEAEFPAVFAGRNPGFDAVIGNPPYIRVRTFKALHPEEAAYLEASYTCATHVWDIYLLFFERALKLSRTGGLSAYIVPIQTLHQPNCESLRRLLFDQTKIRVVADLSQLKVFSGPTVKNAILVVERGLGSAGHILVSKPRQLGDLRSRPHIGSPQKGAWTNPGRSLKVDLLSPKRDLCEKIGQGKHLLSDLFYVTFGLRSCARGKGRGGKDRLVTDDKLAPKARPYLEGRDIGRYRIDWPGHYIRYMPKEMYSPRNAELFEGRKIVSQTMLAKARLVATLDEKGYYVEQSLLCVVPHGLLTPPQQELPEHPLEFVLAIINSTLASFYYATYIIDYSLGGGLIHATPGSQGKLPVASPSAVEVDRCVKAVREMLRLNVELKHAGAGHDHEVISRQIAATDRQIDRLVYELYGLTEEEIRIVEEAR